MKHRILAVPLVLALASSVYGFQAGAAGTTQAPTAAQPGQGASTQQKKDQSECMHWAKQQAGLEQADNSQQPAASGGAAQQGAPAAGQAGQNPPAKPADNSAQSSANSALSGAAQNMAGSAVGGAMNSKAAEVVKEAYANCMQKKGYSKK